MAPDFTPQQFDAIKWRNLDACVVAGPGSGKTTVLVERYRGLIEHEGFAPSEILAITFTEKAAANMKAKLAEKLKPGEIDQAWVSTIHGFCARLLRENAIAAGIDPRFRVLDARESEDLQYKCLNDSLDEMLEQRREETLRMIQALQTPAMTDHLRDAYDAMRSAGVSLAQVRAIPSAANAPTLEQAADLLSTFPWPSLLKPNQSAQRDAVLEWIADVRAGGNPLEVATRLKINLTYVPKPNDDWKRFRDEIMPAVKAGLIDRINAPYREMIFDALIRFEEIYTQAKNKLAALDFNDLERHTIALLFSNPTVRNRVRAQFRQIMLDEFQDINEQQEKLIQSIRGEDTFFAVGDINQSIYGFRHARPEIFARYRDHVRDTAKHSAQLLHNFRSRAEILHFVEALLNSATGIDPRDLIAGAKFTPKHEPSIDVIRAVAEDADEAAAREGKWIAYRIQQLRRTNDFDFRDFAVLCRSREGMTPVVDALTAAGIPNVCGRRESFLLSREGRDITALLQVVANPRDTAAMLTVLRSPLAGMSDEGLLALNLNAGLDPDEASRKSTFDANLKRWRAEQQVISLDLLIVRMLNDCGFAITRHAEDFISLARNRSTATLLDFLREIESMATDPSNEPDLSDEDQGNRVQIMTAHAAKGLEYPVTIIASMHKGVQRNSAPVTFTPRHGLGIKWGAGSGDYDSWGNANKELIEEREEAEANRLLYVAMTRAKEHLVLSYSYTKSQRGDWARKVDEFFGLKEVPLTTEPQTVTNGEVKATAWVTDQDPPPALLIVPRAEDTATEHVAPFEDTEQPETSVSVTALNVFAKCPRKYYIQRYTGWTGARFRRFDPEILADDDVDDESAADLGSAVHDLLAGKPGDYSAEAIRLADVFTSSGLGKRAAAATKQAREWEFIAEIEGTLVRGSVDLWFEENGEIHLVDYKTDELKPTQVSDKAAFYAPQLSLYAEALEKALGQRPAKAALHFLKPNVIAEVPLQSASSLIAKLREAQAKFRFEVSPGDHCQSCEFHRKSCMAGIEKAL